MNKKTNSITSAEAAADSSTTAEVTTSSHNSSKPLVGGSLCLATVIDSTSGQWWCNFLGVTFQVLTIRNETVIVKCCSDEGYKPPYNVHEFPLTAVKINI